MPELRKAVCLELRRDRRAFQSTQRFLSLMAVAPEVERNSRQDLYVPDSRLSIAGKTIPAFSPAAVQAPCEGDQDFSQMAGKAGRQQPWFARTKHFRQHKQPRQN